MPKRNSDCPLFLHRNGQWAKKVRGRFHYFGTDKDEALAKWADEKDHLLAGKKPRRRSGEATLEELVNVYLDHRQRMVDAAEIVDRSLQDDVATLRRVVQIMGKTCYPAFWEPVDFEELKSELAKPIKRTTPLKGGVVIGKQVSRRSPNTVAGDIRRIKAFLNYSYNKKSIPPPMYGMEFQGPSNKAKARLQAKAGRRDISATDLRAIIGQCTLGFKPLVLLGINGGIGNKDIANMALHQLPNLEATTVWLELPRLKTGIPRRTLLWPQTVEALKAYMEKRPTARKGHSDLVFLTKYGLPWLRESGSDRKDAISASFLTYARNAGVEGHSFYDLRRTFLTIAEETLDFPAVQALMGHKPPKSDMSGVYRQHISDARLKNVTDHVRAWLFGEAKPGVSDH